MNIGKISFGFLSEEEISNLSVLDLTPQKGANISNLLSSEKLGPVEPEYKCPTCFKTANNCPGHFGKIKLATPIIHPLPCVIKDLLIYLQIFCSKCGRLVLGKDHLTLNNIHTITNFRDRLKKIQAVVSKIYQCTRDGCDTILFRYYLDGRRIYSYSDFGDKGKSRKNKKVFVVAPSEIYDILSRIPSEELELCGINPSSLHPKNFIIKTIPVLPLISRPYITVEDICEDDITTMYSTIYKIIEKGGNQDEIEEHISRNYYAIMDNSKTKIKRMNGVEKKGIKQRTDGKQGHCRLSQHGKRVDYTGRTVIVGDSYISSSEIGIPQWMADVVTTTEKVTVHNYNSLTALVNEGRAEGITRGDHFILLSLASWRRGTSFQWGDRVRLSVTNEVYLLEIPDGFCLSEENTILRGSSLTYLTYLYEIQSGIFTLTEKVFRQNQLLNNVSVHTILEGDVILKGDKAYHVISPQTVFSAGTILLFTQDNIYYSTKSVDGRTLPDAVLSGGKFIETVAPMRKTVSLQYGDIVHRYLKSGDWVICNRQPTLHKGSMLAAKARVFSQSSRNNLPTIRLNLSHTKSFNADFDGDEFNIHIPQNDAEKIELEMLSSVEANILSGNGVIIGCVQDTVLAAYLMSVENKVLTKEKFYQIAIGAGLSVTGEETYDSYSLLSLLFPKDFFLSRKGVCIEKGVFKRGVLNKDFVGVAKNSIQHHLVKEYSDKRAIQFIDEMQFLAREWLIHFPFSIGIDDCISSVKDLNKEHITQSFRTVESLKEENDITKVLNSLNSKLQKNTLEKISRNNGILKMIESGAKGGLDNLTQISGSLGQQNYLGGRIPMYISGGRRTLCCYSLDMKTPETRGFVSSSFLEGLKPQEVFFHAACGRAGILNTSMTTPESGYNQRQMTRFLEFLKVTYDNTVRDDQNQIVEFNYGSDGILAEQTLLIKTEKQGTVTSFVDVQRLVTKLESGRR